MRRKHDFYETPPHYVDALQRVIGTPTGQLIEPCTGRGAIIDLLKVDGVWQTNDINRRRNTHTHLNAAAPASWQLFTNRRTIHYDWAITNPPFKRTLMLPIVRLMLRYAHNVAILARLSFLEPTIDRAPFWARWAKTCEVIVLPRYSFKRIHGKRTTDSVTCAWLVWRNITPTWANHLTLRSDRQLYVSTLQEKRG